MSRALSCALIVIALGGGAEAQGEGCLDIETREKVRSLIIEGLDEGLRDHVKHLFEVWLKVDDVNQPKRVLSGIRAGAKAYVRSREAARKWNPPTCQ